jgi:NADH:ubiquinone oxidoreductase subunit E
MLLVKLDCGRELIVNQEFYDELRREALKKKEAALIEGLEEIFETYHYIHSNVNQKLAMSVLAGTLGG